jgi:hypothetical protein
LSNQIGLAYYYLIGEGERPSKTQYCTWYFGEDIEVNLQSLSKLMKIANRISLCYSEISEEHEKPSQIFSNRIKAQSFLNRWVKWVDSR